jgi:hypothetical protein
MECRGNNNNAEHAIKGFARVHSFANSRFTENSIREYLVMLSVAETCGYQNIEVLEFLLAQANNSSACQLSLHNQKAECRSEKSAMKWFWRSGQHLWLWSSRCPIQSVEIAPAKNGYSGHRLLCPRMRLRCPRP